MKEIYVFQSSASAIGSLPFFPIDWERIPHAVTRKRDVLTVTFNLVDIWHDFESDCMVNYADMEKNFETCKEYTACDTTREYIEACMDYNNGALEDPADYMRNFCADYMRDMYAGYID